MLRECPVEVGGLIAERENAWEKWEGVDSSAERMPGTSGRVWTRLLRERMPGKSARVWTRVPRERMPGRSGRV